jgi:hypothetical protein
VGAEMKALQEQGIIGDIKHYALNDQESGRSYVNVKVDQRAIRESDLLAFEIGVKESGAGAVMCSYNLLNGDYACENSYLLTGVLKKDFGFQGFVLSDWGGTHSTVKAALAGLDMEMPAILTLRMRSRKQWREGRCPWRASTTWSTAFCVVNSQWAYSTIRRNARCPMFSTASRWPSVSPSSPSSC